MGVSGQDIVQLVSKAGQCQIGLSVCRDVANQGQVFDIGPQSVIVDPGDDRIRPLVDILHDEITGVFDIINIVSPTAFHGVGAKTAVNAVVFPVSGDDVVQIVAATITLSGVRIIIGHDQIFDLGVLQRVAPSDVDRVVSSIFQLDHLVAGAIEKVAVVTVAADHGVIAGAAIDYIVLTVANQFVFGRVACDIYLISDEGQIFDVFMISQGKIDGRNDRIDTLRRIGGVLVEDGLFDNDVARVIDIIGVASSAADHDVCASATIQRVLVVATLEAVIPVAACERVGSGASDEGIVSLAAIYDVAFTSSVDAVIAVSARECIVIAAPQNGVVACAAFN